MISLLEWLEERRDNCERIADLKTGSDRAGWLEDMVYFTAAVEAVEELVSARETIASFR
jgi:hypothetical protein